MTRTLIIILASLVMASCASKNSQLIYIYDAKPNNKAFVTTVDGGWGFSSDQVAEELAIIGAFFECEKRNIIALCELEKINNKYVSSKEEKNKWKELYRTEKNNYIFADNSVSYKDTNKNQLAKQKEIERKNKLLNNKDWKIKMFLYCHPNMDITNDVIYRVEWCKNNKILPYLMRDSACWNSMEKQFYIDLAAYCNQPNIFKKKMKKKIVSK